MELNLGGRTALITGASKGIGAAVAEVMAEEGCNTILAARDSEKLESVAAGLRSRFGTSARAVSTDIRQAEELKALAISADGVDILVNNAGDIPQGDLAAIDEERWRHAWELKVFGYINLTRMIYAHMKARGGGVIVNVIGAAGERMDSRYLAGSTGNAAIYAFTRALGGRSAEDGIRVIGVSPGPVATDRMIGVAKSAALSQWGDESRYPELLTQYPMGRPATPREIANVVAFVASERASYLSGTVITVDGGMCSSQK